MFAIQKDDCETFGRGDVDARKPEDPNDLKRFLISSLAGPCGRLLRSEALGLLAEAIVWWGLFRVEFYPYFWNQLQLGETRSFFLFALGFGPPISFLLLVCPRWAWVEKTPTLTGYEGQIKKTTGGQVCVFTIWLIWPLAAIRSSFCGVCQGELKEAPRIVSMNDWLL